MKIRTGHNRLDAAIQQLLARGYTVERVKHIKLRTPAGRVVATLPTTPGDRRSALNMLSDIRHALEKLGEPPIDA